MHVPGNHPLSPADDIFPRRSHTIRAIAGGTFIALFIAFPFALAGSLWLLPGVLVAALVISAPLIIIGRLLRPSGMRAGSASAAPAEQLAHLKPHTEAGWHVGSSALLGPVISGEHAGARFAQRLIAGTKSTPPRVAVGVATSAPGEFHVYPEEAATEFAKTVGLVKEFELGQAVLDARYYFSGTTPEYLTSVFSVRENVEALRGLFASGFHDLEKTRTALIASRPSPAFLGVSETKGTVELLARFQMPGFVPGGKHPGGDKQVLYLVRSVLGIIIVIGFCGLIVAGSLLLDGVAAFVRAVTPLWIAACVLILAGSYFAFRRRSLVAPRWLEVLVFMLLWVPAIPGALMVANQYLDRSPGETHQVRLLSYRTTTHKGREYYWLTLESWRGRLTETFDVPGPKPSAGQIWKVHVRAGWLGQPWIESLRPVGD